MTAVSLKYDQNLWIFERVPTYLTSHIGVVGQGSRVIDASRVEAAWFKRAVARRGHLLSRFDECLLQLC